MRSWIFATSPASKLIADTPLLSFIYLDKVPFQMHVACQHVIDDIEKRYNPERLPAIELKRLEMGVPNDTVLGDWGRVCQVWIGVVCVKGKRAKGRVVVLNMFRCWFFICS